MHFESADDYGVATQKQVLMDRFNYEDEGGNKLKVRQNAMENWMALLNLGLDDIELLRSKLNVKKEHKGVRISTHIDSNLLEDFFQNNNPNYHENIESDDKIAKIDPAGKLFTYKPYANLGHSLLVEDVNGDNKEDLLIGAPGKELS